MMLVSTKIFHPALLIPRDEVEESAGDSNGMRYAEWDIARLVLTLKWRPFTM
jgi:hypothetical protein